MAGWGTYIKESYPEFEPIFFVSLMLRKSVPFSRASDPPFYFISLLETLL